MPPEHPIILLKSNLFNMAAVSVKRSIKYSCLFSIQRVPWIAIKAICASVWFLPGLLNHLFGNTRSSSCPGHTWIHVIVGRQQMKHFCFLPSPWRVTALIIYPSKGAKCHSKISMKQIAFSNCEHLIKNTKIPAKRDKNWMGTRSSPHIPPCPKWRAS